MPLHRSRRQPYPTMGTRHILERIRPSPPPPGAFAPELISVNPMSITPPLSSSGPSLFDFGPLIILNEVVPHILALASQLVVYGYPLRRFSPPAARCAACFFARSIFDWFC